MINADRTHKILEGFQRAQDGLSRARAEYDHLLDEYMRDEEIKDALLAAAKAAYQGWLDGENVWVPMQNLKAAIAKAES